MSRMTMFERHSQAVLEGIRAGATVGEAGAGEDVAESTIHGWLKRGRKDPLSKYGKFAGQVDEAFTARTMPAPGDRPADRGELLMMATRAARGGSVTAMRLLAELLEPTDKNKGDSLTDFDGKR